MGTPNSGEVKVVEWILGTTSKIFPRPSMQECAQILWSHLESFRPYLKHLVLVPFKDQISDFVTLYREPSFAHVAMSPNTKCVLLVKHQFRDEEGIGVLLLLTDKGELVRWDHPWRGNISGTIRLIDEDGLAELLSEIPESYTDIALYALSSLLQEEIEKRERRISSLKALLKKNEGVYTRLLQQQKS